MRALAVETSQLEEVAVTSARQRFGCEDTEEYTCPLRPGAMMSASSAGSQRFLQRSYFRQLRPPIAHLNADVHRDRCSLLSTLQLSFAVLVECGAPAHRPSGRTQTLAGFAVQNFQKRAGYWPAEDSSAMMKNLLLLSIRLKSSLTRKAPACTSAV